MENLQKDRRYLFNSECMSLFLLRAQNVWIRICLKKKHMKLIERFSVSPSTHFIIAQKGIVFLKLLENL